MTGVQITKAEDGTTTTQLEEIPITYDRGTRPISLFYRIFLSNRCSTCSEKALGPTVVDACI